jgi:hypothetical protein
MVTGQVGTQIPMGHWQLGLEPAFANMHKSPGVVQSASVIQKTPTGHPLAANPFLGSKQTLGPPFLAGKHAHTVPVFENAHVGPAVVAHQSGSDVVQIRLDGALVGEFVVLGNAWTIPPFPLLLQTPTQSVTMALFMGTVFIVAKVIDGCVPCFDSCITKQSRSRSFLVRLRK